MIFYCLTRDPLMSVFPSFAISFPFSRIRSWEQQQRCYQHQDQYSAHKLHLENQNWDSKAETSCQNNCVGILMTTVRRQGTNITWLNKFLGEIHSVEDPQNSQGTCASYICRLLVRHVTRRTSNNVCTHEVSGADSKSIPLL